MIYAGTLKQRAQRLRQIARTGGWALQLAWGAKPRLVAGLAVMTGVVGLAPAGLALVMREIVNALVSPTTPPGEAFRLLLPWLVLGFGFTLAEILGRLLQRFLLGRLNDDVELEVTTRILAHAATLDVASFENPEHQDIIHRARQDTGRRLSRFLADALLLSIQLVQGISLSAILVAVEPLSLVVLLPFAIAHLLSQWRTSKRYYREVVRRAPRQRWNQYFTGLLTDRESVAEVKLLGIAPLLLARFRSIMGGFRDENRRRYLDRLGNASLSGFATTVAVYGLFSNVIYRVIDGVLTVGDVAVFGTAALRLRSVLEGAVTATTSALEQTLYIENFRAFLKLRSRISTGGGRVPAAAGGAIELRNVSFAYPGATGAALSNVSLRLEPGETVALVGLNGAGKTTLVKLLARFYDPDGGSIRWNGVDLRELSLEHVHRRMALVFQNFGRYETTVFENLAYGDPERLLHDREEVERLVRRAGMGPLVDALPEGLDTLLGRRFGNRDLSGGQWQQIAIARALARDAELVILDEPTSNLDAESEYQIFSRFRDLARGRTTVLVSHRFSTVRMADRIAVLEEGSLTENGTHAELLAQGGLYAKLYDLHMRQTEFPTPQDPAADLQDTGT